MIDEKLLRLMKKYFSKDVTLGKELELYQLLVKENFFAWLVYLYLGYIRFLEDCRGAFLSSKYLYF